MFLAEVALQTHVDLEVRYLKIYKKRIHKFQPSKVPICQEWVWKTMANSGGRIHRAVRARSAFNQT